MRIHKGRDGIRRRRLGEVPVQGAEREHGGLGVG